MAGLRPGRRSDRAGHHLHCHDCLPVVDRRKWFWPTSIRGRSIFDPADVARKITSRTRMIVPVHVGGWPVEMGRYHASVQQGRTGGSGGRRPRLRSVATAAAGQEPSDTLAPIASTKSRTSTPSAKAVCWSSNTKYWTAVLEESLSSDWICPSRFPWLYDVTAVEGMRGLFVAGNHSVTEIQAVGLQKARWPVTIGSLPAAGALGRNPQSPLRPGAAACWVRPWTTGSTKRHPSPVPVTDRSGPDRRQHPRPERQAFPARRDANRPLRSALSVPDHKQLGYDTASIRASCPRAEDVFANRFTHLPLYGLTAAQIRYLGDAVIESVAELRAGR